MHTQHKHAATRTDLEQATRLISILLDNYEDVLHGLRDTQGTGDHLPLMCAAWNHPSYQQLERLLPRLRRLEPSLYHHLAETYLRPAHHRRMQCPRCHATYPPWNHPNTHTHHRQHIALVPTITRRHTTTVNAELVHQAIRWLHKHWRGPINLPPELTHLNG